MADTQTTDAPADATDQPDTDQPDQTDTSQDTTDWKAMARKHEREAKKARQEAEALRQQNQTEAEKALEEAKKAGRTEAETELGTQVMSLRMENAVLRSEHAKKLADPADALQFLNPSELADDDGHVDPKKLGAAIDALLERKPYLGSAAPPPRVPNGPRSDGTPGGSVMNRLIRGG